MSALSIKKPRYFKVILSIICFALAMLFIYYYKYYNHPYRDHTNVADTQSQDYAMKKIRIDGRPLVAYVASTDLQMQKGLAGFQDLPDNKGMLFEFGRLGKYEFWMKDMQIPIDIIWIKDKRVIGITANVSPEPGVSESDLTKYFPPEDVDTVLEVSAGWAVKYGIQVGNEVK